MTKDHLIVQAGLRLLDATLTVTTVPADEVGPTYKKYAYALSDGRGISYGYSRREALAQLLSRANVEGWKVLQPLN